MRIRELATSPAVTCKGSTPISDVAAFMRDAGVGSVVVVGDDESPIGICTDRDLVVRALAGSWPASTPVRAAMTEDVETVPAALDALVAAERMRSHAHRRLPVVDEEGQVVGVLSAVDLAQFVATELDRVAELLRGDRAGSKVPNAGDLGP